MSTRTPLRNGLRFEVLQRDNFTCRYCGRKAPEVKLHIDHVHPVAEGGTNDIDNLVTACQECNSGKRAKVLKPLNGYQLAQMEVHSSQWDADVAQLNGQIFLRVWRELNAIKKKCPSLLVNMQSYHEALDGIPPLIKDEPLHLKPADLLLQICKINSRLDEVRQDVSWLLDMWQILCSAHGICELDIDWSELNDY